MTHDPWGEVLAEAGRLSAAAEGRLGWPHVPPKFQDPPEGMGDVAIPAFPYAKHARRGPPELAADLAKAMPPSTWFHKVEASGGFVNLFIDAAKLAQVTLTAVRERGDSYGHLPPNGKRLLLEHTSVNPTGPLHVGRARNSLIGDALARVMRLAGYDVATEFLVNDVGRQMVLLTWGVRNIPEAEMPPPERDRDDYRLVRSYRAANAKVEERPELDREIEEMIYRLENGDRALTQEVHGIAERILAGIRATLERLDIRFDSFFWESSLILDDRVEPVVQRLLALPQTAVQEDGAAYIDTAPFGVSGRETKWFVTRKDGTSLYPTRDVAYHLDKFTRCDEAIVVLGENHKLENTQLRIALKLMDVGKDVEPVFYSYVSLPEGAMSTRKGRVVHVDDLIDEAVERAYEEVDKRRHDLPEARKREIAEFVGIGALRYNIGRVQAEKKITFRWEDALNFEGDSAPFLQYAHARACGILAKAGAISADATVSASHESEVRLVKLLARLPATIASCAAARRVHPLAAYAYALAAQFHLFYDACPVLAAEEPARSSRLLLVEAARIALGNALRGLGLRAPEEM